MSKFTFSIQNAIALIADPVILALKRLVTRPNDTYTDKQIVLTGDATGSGSIVSGGTTTVDTTIDPNKHSHGPASLPASSAGTPNTFVVRDGLGRIYSSGTSKEHTGYTLANGTDIGGLFRSPDMTNDPSISVQTVVNGTGIAVTDAYITVVDNVVTLYLTLAEL